MAINISPHKFNNCPVRKETISESNPLHVDHNTTTISIVEMYNCANMKWTCILSCQRLHHYEIINKCDATCFGIQPMLFISLSDKYWTCFSVKWQYVTHSIIINMYNVLIGVNTNQVFPSTMGKHLSINFITQYI